MRFFVCLLDPMGRAIPDSLRHKYEAMPRSRGATFRWQLFDSAAVLTGGDTNDGELFLAGIADYGLVVGRVRLDNRSDLMRRCECNDSDMGDLELVGRMVAQHGPRCVPQILGDFAFLVWSTSTFTGVATCDALGTRRIYYAQHDGILAFASRGEMLAVEEAYDVQYLAEQVAGCCPSPGLTPYRGVTYVDGGTMVLLEGGTISRRRYWSAYDFVADRQSTRSEREAAHTCRGLLAEAVALRLTGQDDTWAHLSGGMDSSSVVSIAQWLAERGTVSHGLAGTLTYVDSQGLAGDERHYVNAVLQRWPVRNETIVSSHPEPGNEADALNTDEPPTSILTSEHSNRLCELISSAGGRVLLTGAGGDMLFGGTMFFFADWVAKGHIWAAAREMLRRAAIGRVSFWELAYRNAVLPMLPRVLHQRLVRDEGGVPPWIDRTVARRYGLHELYAAPFLYGGRVGHKYQDAVAGGVAQVSASLATGLMHERLDVRHPFYYRPLVEFALKLPPELCVRPYARKWVLREAMAGILPETVRTRVGKGSYDAGVTRSLARGGASVERLTRNSVLADLGIIDVNGLRAMADGIKYEREGRHSMSDTVSSALTIEAWLRQRSGRWPCGEQVRRTLQSTSSPVLAVRGSQRRNI